MMRTSKYLEKGCDWRSPKVIEMTQYQAQMARYGDDDRLSLVSSQEAEALREQVAKLKGNRDQLAKVERQIADLQTREDDGSLSARFQLRKNLANNVHKLERMVTDCADRAEALSVAERGEDHPGTLNLRKRAAQARALVQGTSVCETGQCTEEAAVGRTCVEHTRT